jgi:DNA polymerase/3'-5' exonuclease PolX
MSETTTRISRSEAVAIAHELVDLLGPYCERLVVAGSLRRRAVSIGDIDVVAVPKVELLRDMFGEDTPTGLDLLDAALDRLCGEQVVRQRRDRNNRPCWGPRLKRGIFRGVAVDICATEADHFGLLVLIRTGPSAYSHAFVTPRSQTAILRDRDGKPVGKRPGLLPPGFEIRDGFRLYRAGALVPTPDERTLYDALGLPYLEPWERR